MATFSGVLGNRPALGLLENALESGEVSHAYLFYGPPGVGKRTVAYRFGAELVSGGSEHSRDRTLRGLHPDLSERWLVGVQWHAEAMRDAGPEHCNLFRAHVVAAECYALSRAAA